MTCRLPAPAAPVVGHQLPANLSTAPRNASAAAPPVCSRRVLQRAATGGNGSSSSSMGGGGSLNLPAPFSDMGAPVLSGPISVLSDAERARLDDTPDGTFWGSTPRMMQHADPDWLQALTGLYAAVLPSGGARVLELGASHSSHLPPGLHLRLCVGLGMNAQELAANSSLHQWFIQDLNLQPLLLEQLDASFDAVLACNTLQYLTDPETVLHEAARVLRPGGVCVVSFGPDCFRERAWAGWLTRSMQERSELLSRILQDNGFDTPRVFDAAAAIQAAVEAGSSSPQAARPPGASSIDLQVLVATKLQTWTAGAAPPDAPEVPMSAENVQAWFSKPGLSGLAEAAEQQQQQAVPPAAAPQEQQQQQHGSNGAQPPLPANERLLEQWRAGYASLVADAVELGIPRSVIPALPPDAAPADIQAAVQHLQAMMASFLSAGL